MCNFLARFAVVAAVAAVPFCLPAQNFAGSSDAADNTSAKASKPAKPAKYEPPKFVTADIHDGTLNVDGMVAKIHLEYEINNAGYLYIYVPGEGTAVLSRNKAEGFERVKDAFHGKTLAFAAGGHDFKLESADLILGKRAEEAYVRFDTDSAAASMGNYPKMGFGTATAAPYAWPGALPPTAAEAAAEAKREDGTNAPPLPHYILPTRITIANSAAPTPSGSR